MDFSFAIEALKSRPLTSGPEVYEAVRRELTRKDGKNICPEIWSWLAQIQEVTDEEPTEGAILAATAAASHLVKSKKNLSVDIDVIAKLLMNVLLKLLSLSPSVLCKDLYDNVSKIKLKASRVSRSLLLNLQVCNMKINGSFDEWKFYESWLPLSKEDPPKAEYFLSLVMHTWGACPEVFLSAWKLFAKIYDEKTFIEKVVDKMAPKFMQNHQELLYQSLAELKVRERVAWRIVCHGTCYSFENLVGPDYKAVANRVIALNKCFREEQAPAIQSPAILSATLLIRDELCSWLYRSYPLFKARPDVLSFLVDIISVIEDNNLLCQYARIAYDNQNHPLCLCLLSHATGPEVSKFLYGLGGALVNRGAINEASLFFERLLQTNEHVSMKQLETITSVYTRAGLYDKARSVLAVAIRREPIPSLMERFCSLPVSEMDWSDKGLLERVLPVAISGKAHSSLLDCVLRSQVEHVLYYKHLYYLRKHRSAPIEDLLAESLPMPPVFRSVWSFALGEDPRVIEDVDLLSKEYNLLVKAFEETFAQLAMIPLEMRLQAIGDLHRCLSECESRLRNTSLKSRSFISDSTTTLQIVGLLCRLSHAYKHVGVWKPTRAYLCQAMELCKSMWPKRDQLWRGLEGALYDLDLLATGSSDLNPFSNSVSNWMLPSQSSNPASASPCDSSPVIYSAVSEEGLAITYDAYMNSSPHEFSQTVLHCLANRSLPICEALGLLALSQSIPFDLRDRVERKAFNEPFPQVPNWPEYLCKLATRHSSDPVLVFIFDQARQNLVMANFQFQRIIIVPALTMQSLIGSLDTILAENKKMLFTKKDHVDVSSADFKRKWWKTRQTLDLSLGKIAGQMDSDLLFLFKALFGSNVGEDKINRMQAALAESFPDFTSAAETLLLYGPTPKASVLESLLRLVSSGIPFDNKARTIKELRRCFERTFVDEDVFSDAPISACIPEEIYLVLDKNLHLLPWEVTPSLRNIRVYRQASFWHLERQIATRLLDDPVTYILNPGGDLRQTEAFFSEKFRPNWRGIVGRPPQEQEFLDSLASSNLFMYFGHGGGDAYVNGTRIRSLPKVAPSFLIGCSSGRLKALGPFCPEGTFLNYMYAGCPTILVNLWDVTDKDIDKFTDCLLTKLKLYPDGEKKNDDGANLGEAVDDARQVCFLQHLNGAAPVIYGVPFV